MSTQPLFLDNPIAEDFRFMKTAGAETKLSDAADNWPQEILGEAYKQLPFLGSFDVNVVLDKVIEEKGYAFGSLEVRPFSSKPEEERYTSLKMVHIPLLIKDQKLQPLDIFVYGKHYNFLTESRLRSVLHRADTFDTTGQRPTDPPFGAEMMPPPQGMSYSSGVKMGSAVAPAPAPTPMAPPTTLAAKPPAPEINPAQATPAMPKMAQLVPLLPQLQGRVSSIHSDRLKIAMQDPSVMSAYKNANEGVQAAMLSALGLKPTSFMKTAEVMAGFIKPDAVQIQKTDHGTYLVKWAAADPFVPMQQELPPQQATALAGNGQMATDLQQSGVATAAPTAQVEAPVEDPEVKPIDQFALCKVEDINGNQLVGWVFPHVFSLNMEPLPLALFTNGSQYALQEMVAGKFLGKAVDLPTTQPQGYGCFYCVKGGSAKAYVPMQVTGTFRDPQGMVNYISATDSGEKVTFYFSESVTEMVRVAEGQLIVPNHFSWMPLKGKVELVSDPSMFTKTAVSKWVNTAELVSDGSLYSYRGPAIAKVASHHVKFLDKPQAEFIGVLLGMTPLFVKQAMYHASHGKTVELKGLRTLVPAAEKLASARENVRQELSEIKVPIRNYFLIKEASILDDALTADKILGLGFLNAENVATFVSMLPSLETAMSKLAELLLACRLGIREVPEVAVERMLYAMDDVIKGLRTLQQKEIRFAE